MRQQNQWKMTARTSYLPTGVRVLLAALGMVDTRIPALEIARAGADGRRYVGHRYKAFHDCQ